MARVVLDAGAEPGGHMTLAASSSFMLDVLVALSILALLLSGPIGGRE